MGGREEEEEKLVVEVVAAHNLMPKDGQGSSSPYVEVEFEHQKRRTRSVPKELNPVWNERLLFPVSDPDDLPYRAIDVAVYNDRAHAHGGGARNFLGRVRVPAAGVPPPGEDAVPQLFPLEKRSLFSHIRGEISLKIYRAYGHAHAHAHAHAPAQQVGLGPGPGAAKAKEKAAPKHQKQQQQQPPPHLPPAVVAQQQQQQPSAAQKQPRPRPGPELSGPAGAIKPVILATGPALGPEPYPVLGVVGAGAQEFALKETRPRLGGAAAAAGHRDKSSATYDLVEQVQYLYVRVVRARDLPLSGGGGEVHAEVKLGNYRGVTPPAPASAAHWGQVFAFSGDSVHSSVAEVLVKERDREESIGRVVFDLSEVPRRVPPDSPLAPQWYRLEDPKGDRGPAPAHRRGELMASAWFGTQADEAFAEGWHSKAAGVHGDGLGSIKSKVYVAPKLWYLRVSVLEAQDLPPGPGDKARFPELFARAMVGAQILRTRAAAPAHPNPVWAEDLMFVVAEPFDDLLVVSVEDRVGPGRDDVLGRVAVPVSSVERRWDDKQVASRWFPLDRSGGSGAQGGRFGASRVHLRLSLDGGYHVLDESTMHSSDLRPTAKQLWAPHVGVLELGVLGAAALAPMKPPREGKAGSADAYCVAKYAQKWVRTRTVIDSLCPRWNEQYTWEVFDPCTVITVGVFDNCHVDRTSSSPPPRDARIGKIRIRLSTLETDRVYTHAYPLLMLHPSSGVKKMGELHLAVRFSCANAANMLHAYAGPLLPKMHYADPLLVRQVENLRYQATNVVAARLGRAEPPLGREVVEYMLDRGSHLWSMRRSKANFFRLVAVLSGPIAVGRWIESVRSWTRPVHSFLVASAYALFVLFPELILPTMFSALAVAGLWRYRSRERQPPHMDVRLSYADAVFADELDEEFDTFPTSRGPEAVRLRYDRLRSVAGRVQTVVGDVGTQGERVQALLSWRDPRATLVFLAFCVVAAAALYAVPMKAILGVWGLYALRPPRFRSRMPSPFMSFFRRLPTKADSLL
uniref:FT-interacting protein 3 n=1 Tax=Puya raimondii TaxID=112807 RepID=A0A8A0WI16_PUYRA|nr:FT-interacting protein 3 [Puya raimondii]